MQTIAGVIEEFKRTLKEFIRPILENKLTQTESARTKIGLFLERFPDYAKTFRLALAHEESSSGSRNYQGWQWHDVETHPTRLIRLVTEGITSINLRTRQATYYLLRDRDEVRRLLERPADRKH